MSKLIGYYFKRDKWILLAILVLSLVGSFFLGHVSVKRADGSVSVAIGFFSFFLAVTVGPLWLYIRDYKRMYGAYGSFFSALPLTGREVIGARTIWLLLVSLSILVAVGLVFGPILVQSVENYSDFRDFIFDLLDALDARYVAGGVLVSISNMIFGVMTWIFMTSVGSEKPFRRFGIGGPVMLFVGVEAVLIAVDKLVMHVMAGQVHYGSEAAVMRMMGQQVLKTSLVSSGLMLIGAAVMFLRSVYSHDKKLSIS